MVGHIESIRAILLSKIPYPQKRISSLLSNLRVEHTLEYYFLYDDKFFFVDIFINSTNKYLEIDGRHHKESKQKGDDRFRKSWLRKNFGLKEYRLKNSKAVKITKEELRIFLEL